MKVVRDAQINVRLASATRTALAQIARDDDWSVSAVVLMLIERFIRDHERGAKKLRPRRILARKKAAGPAANGTGRQAATQRTPKPMTLGREHDYHDDAQRDAIAFNNADAATQAKPDRCPLLGTPIHAD